jgi:hypothetical protein
MPLRFFGGVDWILETGIKCVENNGRPIFISEPHFTYGEEK